MYDMYPTRLYVLLFGITWIPVFVLLYSSKSVPNVICGQKQIVRLASFILQPYQNIGIDKIKTSF